MEDYIYKNIEKYGNCYINCKTYKKIGKRNLLNDLKEHGYVCTIRKEKDHYADASGVAFTEEDIIVEVIRSVKNEKQ